MRFVCDSDEQQYCEHGYFRGLATSWIDEISPGGCVIVNGAWFECDGKYVTVRAFDFPKEQLEKRRRVPRGFLRVAVGDGWYVDEQILPDNPVVVENKL
jgi:hypothetical protein